MPFNYNFQTDDQVISQKWTKANIGSSQSLPAAKLSDEQIVSLQNDNPEVVQANLGQDQKYQIKYSDKSLTIRRAKSVDAARIIEINKKSWVATYPNPEFGITTEDMLARDWQKALEKSQRNIENETDFWLLEVESYSENKNSETVQNLNLVAKKANLDQEKNVQGGIDKNKNNSSENQNSAANPAEKEIVGYVRFLINEENRSEIKAIYLDPDFVSLGLGTVLMIFALERLGFERNFEIKAASYNQRAIKFYQKFGFKISDKKIENFQLENGKFLPQVQLLVNKDKLQKKLTEIKTELAARKIILPSFAQDFQSENFLPIGESGDQNRENANSVDNLEDQKQQKFLEIMNNLEKSEVLENLETPNLGKSTNSRLSQDLVQQDKEKTESKSEPETFTILMPPPNLTGNLHAGHALEHYIMDSLSRFERQNSKQVLYYPGIDHAGIQLEGVINKLINKGEFDQIIQEKIGQNLANLDQENPSLSTNSQDSLSSDQTLANKTTDLEKIVVGEETNNFEDNVSGFSQFQAQKIEDRANWLKKNFPELWLECAWSKVSLWRNNQKDQSMILGDSPDWDKQLFTLDERAVDMVNLAFATYWRDGLIYRDSYLINWSVALQTALSDVPEDIGRSEKVDPFVTFVYKAAQIKSNSINFEIQNLVTKINQQANNLQFLVATVRIETVFADVAVAIHPEKLAQTFDFLNPQEINLLRDCLNNHSIIIFLQIEPLGVGNIQLIIDDSVDLAFGTGLLKITPAHDLADYNIAKKHHFTSFSQAVGRDGKLTDLCGQYGGLTVEAARPLIIKKLLETGYVPSKNVVS